MTDEFRGVPCCKPLRLLELFCMTLSFILIFFTRTPSEESGILLSNPVLIFIVITYASFLVLIAGDVFSQLVREPVSNTPMTLVTVAGSAFCFVSGALLLSFYFKHNDCPFHRTLNVIGFLSGASFFSSMVFLIDALVLIRFINY